ncbi:MAG: T9SS type A sorting domain-containing protein [Bacteroidia bacterium]|nr:T9SS type A sorting domain-containing protein [Bacteroidia bacterium]
MKRGNTTLILICLSLLVSGFASGQTLVGKSFSKYATANHNQRKIVRVSTGDIYLTYQDSSEMGYFIRMAKYDSIAGTWSQADSLFPGSCPTMAVSADDNLFIAYLKADSTICFVQKTTGGWTSPVTVSQPNTTNRLPVADVSQNGLLHIIWIETGSTGLESVVYSNSTLAGNVKTIFSDTAHVGINDVAIANSLLYTDDCIYFVYSLDNGYISGFMETCNNGDSITNVFYPYTGDTVVGSFPCLTATFGLGHDVTETYYWIDYGNYSLVRAYLNSTKHYISNPAGGGSEIDTSFCGQIDYLCIDDLASFLGYSFLYVHNSKLYQAFSYVLYYAEVQDTLSYHALFPTIAYKHFNILNTDVAWMEFNGVNYNIFYKRLDKIQQVTSVPDLSENISITAFPNPAKDFVLFNADLKEASECNIIIYNLKGSIIKEFNDQSSGNHHSFSWDLKNISGTRIAAGTYLVKVSCGNKRAARKIVIN